MFTCDLFNNKSHVDINKSHVDIIMLHVDINKLHVHIIMLHVDINKLHVHIIMLHVDIIYLACRGQKYATIVLISSNSRIVLLYLNVR